MTCVYNKVRQAALYSFFKDIKVDLDKKFSRETKIEMRD